MGAILAGLRCQPFVGFDCLLVAGTPVRDLLLGAKHLFVDARASGELGRAENRHYHATKVQ